LVESTQNTVVTFVLDESASMTSVWDETISGFNEYIETLQADNRPTVIRLLSFNSKRLSGLYNFEDIQKVEPMTNQVYRPDGNTPLYDSIAKGILDTDDILEYSGNEANVMFTIMTDGMENSSKHFTFMDIARMVEQREKDGWIFTFLGANQDAWREGRKFGIQRKYASNYQASNPKEAFKVMAESTLRAKGGWSTARRASQFYTEDEKERLLRKKIK